MSTSLVTVICWALACLNASGQSAQKPPTGVADAFLLAHRAAVAANPAGVQLTLRLVNDGSAFRQGDAVDLELAFTGDPGLPVRPQPR